MASAVTVGKKVGNVRSRFTQVFATGLYTKPYVLFPPVSALKVITPPGLMPVAWPDSKPPGGVTSSAWYALAACAGAAPALASATTLAASAPTTELPVGKRRIAPPIVGEAAG